MSLIFNINDVINVTKLNRNIRSHGNFFEYVAYYESVCALIQPV